MSDGNDDGLEFRTFSDRVAGHSVLLCHDAATVRKLIPIFRGDVMSISSRVDGS